MSDDEIKTRRLLREKQIELINYVLIKTKDDEKRFILTTIRTLVDHMGKDQDITIEHEYRIEHLEKTLKDLKDSKEL